MLQVTPHLRSTCDRIIELPIVMKHNHCLPEEMQGDDKVDAKLLDTIRLKLDAKQQLSIAMPKPRYINTIEYSEKIRQSRTTH